MRFREATIEDYEYMAINSINQKVDRKMEDTVDYAYTLEDDGKPLGMGGFRMITSTTAWAWVDLSHEAGKNIITAYRVIRDWMIDFCEKMNIKRLQAFVRTDFPEAERLVQHLGFEKESKMVGFFDDKDAWMYVKFLSETKCSTK